MGSEMNATLLADALSRLGLPNFHLFTFYLLQV